MPNLIKSVQRPLASLQADHMTLDGPSIETVAAPTRALQDDAACSQGAVPIVISTSDDDDAQAGPDSGAGEDYGSGDAGVDDGDSGPLGQLLLRVEKELRRHAKAEAQAATGSAAGLADFQEAEEDVMFTLRDTLKKLTGQLLMMTVRVASDEYVGAFLIRQPRAGQGRTGTGTGSGTTRCSR